MLNLDGAFAKLVRAYEHLAEFDEAFETFAAIPNLYRMRFEPHFKDIKWVLCTADDIDRLGIPKDRLRRRKRDGRIGTFVPVSADVDVFAEPCVEAPVERWGLIVGDVIHNLRSALDHLIFSLTCFHPPPIGKTPPQPFTYLWRRIQFPIATTEEEWMNERTGFPALLWGVPPELRARIRRMQPYVTGQRPGRLPKSEILTLLQELWNVDKHRELTVVTVGMGFEYARAFLPGQRDEFLTPTIRRHPFGPLAIDAPIGVVHYCVPPSPRLWKMDVQMQVKCLIDVAFDQRSPAKEILVRPFLNDACDLVARILIAFEWLHRDDTDITHEAPPA